MELKYPKVTLKRIQDVWDKLGGEEGVDKLLRGELSVSEPTRSWREEDGVIYLPPLITDGTTGPEWEQWYDKNGYNLSKEARFILNSPDFKATNGVTTEVAVLKGMLFENNNRITRKIRAYAEAFRTPDKRKLLKPNAELACLIRKEFTDEEIEAMGLWYIVAMHKLINNFVGDSLLLSASRRDDGRWLNACYDGPDDGWDRGFGFAFAVSQVSSQH